MLQGWYPREARKVGRTFVGVKSQEKDWKMGCKKKGEMAGSSLSPGVSRAGWVARVNESDERKRGNESLKSMELWVPT